jgi:glycosyltransferase involved in cell wall biosynthesis
VWAAVSETRRRELLAARVGDDENVVVVANPIDPLDVVPARRVVHDGFVAGYLGCEYEPKGITILPAIARELRSSRARILCVVKGIDRKTLSPSVAQALDELDELDDVVTFHARTFEVSEVFAQLDAVLVPSYAESFCRVAAEGMTNGLPVVASDLPAIRELVDDDAGVLFATGDAQGAAGAIANLARDPERAKSLGARGAARAEAFLPERVVARLLALYR